MTTSFVTELKNIAGTAIELGREITKAQISNAVESAKGSRAWQMLGSVRTRFDGARRKQAAGINSPAKADTHHVRVQKEYSFSKKRHLGDKKYDAKTAHLSHM